MPSPCARADAAQLAAAAVAAAASGSSKSRSWRSSLAVSRHSPSGDHLTPFTQLFGSVASRNSSQQPQIASVVLLEVLGVVPLAETSASLSEVAVDIVRAVQCTSVQVWADRCGLQRSFSRAQRFLHVGELGREIVAAARARLDLLVGRQLPSAAQLQDFPSRPSSTTMADEPDAVFTPRGTHPLVESSVSLDVAHEDAPVSYAKGCRRAARKVFGALCFYYFCACCACCKAFDLPVRALLTIACFETLAVGGYVANMLVMAFGTEEDVDKAVYFVLATMSMLALTLWVFMLSAVRRENGYELAGADLMSSCLSVMPILLQFVQSERLSLESGAVASSLDGRGDDGASDF